MESFRRYLKVFVLTFVFVLLLSACVRPLTQDDSEEAAAATQVAEEAAAAEEAGEAEESTGEETESESPREEEAADVSESEEAQSSDSDVGGGTPDTAEEDPDMATEAEEEAESEAEEAEGEESSEDTVVDETTEEAAEDTAVAAAAEESTEGDAAEETTEADASDVPDTAEPAAEEPAVQSTLPATHVVAPGENLFRIGLKYGMSWVPIAVYNNLPNPHRIYVGQVLRIPGGQPTPPPSGPESPSYINYTVKWGDTMYRISKAFGVSVEEIAEANGIMNPNLIYAGQVLKIPTGAPGST